MATYTPNIALNAGLPPPLTPEPSPYFDPSQYSYTDEATVKHYLATGVGVTQQQAQWNARCIQNAINAAKLSGGGTVLTGVLPIPSRGFSSITAKPRTSSSPNASSAAISSSASMSPGDS